MGKRMKKSFYNIEIRENGTNLVFNTKTRACVFLDNTEMEAYNNLQGEVADSLVKLGFWVESNCNEQENVLKIIQDNIERDANNIRSHTIYTTTYCNAHCYYCFENNLKKESMTANTAIDVANYIIRKQGNAKKLYVIWFGGEPLLNTNVIDIISSEIKKQLPAGVEYRSSIYTNGILFSDELIKHSIEEWNLKAVQVTIDGLKQTYERVKGFNLDNSFDDVVNRISAVANAGLRVQVRVNYDETNFNEVLELIEFLKNKYMQYNNVFVYAYKIFKPENEDNSKNNSVDYDFIIFKKLVETGFCQDILESIKGNMNTCIAGSEYSTLYLPSGQIIKCDRDCKSVVGDIYGNINDLEMRKWINNRINSMCYQCKMLPLCGGGCIYEFINGKKGCMISEDLVKRKLQYYIEYINSNCSN